MKNFFVIFLLMFMISCSTCGEQDNISTVCIEDITCSILNEKIETYENKSPPPNIKNCNLGKVKCVNDTIECVNFILPIDADNDGFTSCEDCNDTNFEINPNKEEICDNTDNNCSGEIDENLIKECWSGEKNNFFGENSLCKKGKSVCEQGIWGSCLGEVLPKKEICDLEKMDEDCNGLGNETVFKSCGFNNVGACRVGDKICTPDGETACINATLPQNEICDGIDNDCNFIIDEGLFQLCSTKCGEGFEICGGGIWAGCTALKPTIEICDSIDNDCDGTVDNDCVCEDGSIQSCINGILDINNNPVTCGVGAQLCSNGVWGVCRLFGTAEEKCNNWDDDCINGIDSFTKTCGDASSAGIGVCSLGEKICEAGSWSSCMGEVIPKAEVCNHLDDDCDNETDEDLNPHEKVDIVFAIDISGSMCASILVLKDGIANYVLDFSGTEHRFGLVVFPPTGWDAYDVMTTPPLVDVNSFLAVLSSLYCYGAGNEPAYDVMMDLASQTHSLTFGWRSDAFPYIVLITDEMAESWYGIMEGSIALKTQNCLLGNCMVGDRIETFVITLPEFFNQWDEITYFERERLIDINPKNSNRYTDLLRGIFTNICL